MNEDQYPIQAKNNSVQPTEVSQEKEADIPADRIFDITPDMNISQVKDIDSPSPFLPQTNTSNTTQSANQQLVEKSLAKELGNSTVPAKEIPAEIPNIDQQSRVIPLQNIPIFTQSQRTSPANPPTKTVGGFVRSEEVPAIPKAPENLQSAVTSILPKNITAEKSTVVPPISHTNISPLTEQNPSIKNLRTYEDDVAEVMSHRRTSTASIAIAQKKADTIEKEKFIEERTPSHTGKNILLFLISLILIGSGVIGSYYLYTLSPLAISQKTAPVVQQSTPSAIVMADSRSTISTENSGSGSLLSKIKTEFNVDQKPNTIKEIVLTEIQNTKTVRVPATDAIHLLDINVPQIMVRSLTPVWMLGVYDDKANNKNAFVIVTTNFFQNTFAGMLQWEQLMPDDLKQYLFPITNFTNNIEVSTPQTVAKPPEIATSSSTTTKKSAASKKVQTPVISTTTIEKNIVSTIPSNKGHFTDRIIHNKDVRVFVTNSGKTLFLYSFIDNTKLIIAGSEDTLIEVLSRLEKQTYVR